MVHGLDVGPGAIRSVADASDGGPIASVPPVVRPIDGPTRESVGDSTGTAPTIERDGTTYVVGTNAVDGTERKHESLFEDGDLIDAPYAAPALAAIVADLLEGASVDELWYATPGVADGAASPGVRRALETATADLDATVTAISRGFAVVYDQLAADNYTGLGICLGPQTTSVALAYYGVPAMTVSIARGSEWVVERTADRADASPTRVEDALETFELDPDEPGGPLERGLAGSYDALVGDLVEAVAAEADARDVERGPAIPVAVAGPGVVDGLEYLLGGRLDAAPLPLSVRGVRAADEPAASAARGALAAARDGADESTTGDDGATTLTFDDGTATAARETDDGTASRPTNSVVTPDGELGASGEDVDDALSALEYVESGSAASEEAAALVRRLEAAADDLAALEREPPTAVDARLDELRADVDDLADDLADASRDRAPEAERVTAIEREVEGLVATVDRLEGGLDDESAVRETVAEARSRVESIRADVDDLAGDLEMVEDRVVVVQDRVNDLRTDLEVTAEELSGDVATAERRTETLERRLADLEDEVSAVDAELDALERGGGELDAAVASQLDELATRANELDERTAELSARLDEGEDRRASATDRLSSVEERLGALEGRLEDDLGALERDLATVRADRRSSPVLATPVVAGGGGAGLVAGAVAALSGDAALGASAALAGAILIGVAVLLVR